MSTRRGPKVEPHENPRVENEIKNSWEESGILDGLTGNIDRMKKSTKSTIVFSS